ATVLASGQVQLGFCSTSERMARQVQHLLLRFGVIAALRCRQVAYRGSRRTAFQLDITDAESIRTFIGEIGIFGKEAALCRAKAASRRSDIRRTAISYRPRLGGRSMRRGRARAGSPLAPSWASRMA